MPTGTTILRPNASGAYAPFGWSGSGGGLPNFWWLLCDETPPDGDTSYIYKAGGRSGYSLMYFEDLLDGETPPPSENVTIKNCTIYMNCRDFAHSFPSTSSSVAIEVNGWSVFRPTFYNPTGLYTYISSYWETRYDAGGYRSITVADVNNACCDVSCTLGSGVNFRVTQMYVEVNWETNATVHLKGGTVLGGCLVK